MAGPNVKHLTGKTFLELILNKIKIQTWFGKVKHLFKEAATRGVL